MLARLASCFLACVALVVISAADLCAQTRKTAEKTKGDFAGAKAGEEWDGNSLKMKFCWCPAGTFMMGSPRSEKDRDEDEEQVAVTLSEGFWLGKYEVTKKEWEQLMPPPKPPQPKGKRRATVTSEAHPAVWINWPDALEFCNKLTADERRSGRLPPTWTYTLPTEAQWEYACRAGTTSASAFGDTLASTQANFNGSHPYNGAPKGPYFGQASAVGSYRGNSWSLCDMHGNVWEWCSDWYLDSLPGGTDPFVETLKGHKRRLDNPRRVFRGGDWYGTGGACRSAHRAHGPPETANSATGLRVAIAFSAPK